MSAPGAERLEAAPDVAMVRDAGERVPGRDVSHLVLVPAVGRAVVRHAEAVRHPDVAGEQLRVELGGEGEGAATGDDADGIAVPAAERARIGGRQIEGTVRPASLPPGGIAVDRVRGPARPEPGGEDQRVFGVVRGWSRGGAAELREHGVGGETDT